MITKKYWGVIMKNEIIEIRNDIYEIYNKLAVCSKKSLQLSENDGNNICCITSDFNVFYIPETYYGWYKPWRC